MGITREQSFLKYVEERYKGKVRMMERLYLPSESGMRVVIEFHIPEGEADEIEMYRRIIRVLEVIAEGEE
jgi:hypothetical protein